MATFKTDYHDEYILRIAKAIGMAAQAFLDPEEFDIPRPIEGDNSVYNYIPGTLPPGRHY